MIKKIIFFASIVVLSLCLATYYMCVKNGYLEEDVTVSIPSGATLRSVAKTMEEAGVIDNPFLFEILARVKKVDRKLKAGEYLFTEAISLSEVIDRIESGKVFYRRITLTEGLTTKQFLEIIKAEENLVGDITINVKEGSMLGETYMFSKGDTRDSIVIQAQKALDEVLNELWGQRKNMMLKDKYEALILASIIEKETSLEEEKTLIASVFMNRIKKRMRLQTDPTVVYALTKGENFFLGRSLKRADMKVDSPYNTYLYGGLTPTPICNVSVSSIKAALNPDDTDFLFFVANGNGGHNFSKTYNEHKTNIKDWVNKIRGNN